MQHALMCKTDKQCKTYLTYSCSLKTANSDGNTDCPEHTLMCQVQSQQAQQFATAAEAQTLTSIVPNCLEAPSDSYHGRWPAFLCHTPQHHNPCSSYLRRLRRRPVMQRPALLMQYTSVNISALHAVLYNLHGLAHIVPSTLQHPHNHSGRHVHLALQTWYEKTQEEMPLQVYCKKQEETQCQQYPTASADA